MVSATRCIAPVPIAPAPAYAPSPSPVRRPDVITRIEEPKGPSAWTGRLGVAVGWLVLIGLIVAAGLFNAGFTVMRSV